jgi:hypothetical protein
MQVKLDEANWADIKEVRELRRADRRAVNAATGFEVDPETRRMIMRGSTDDAIADAVLRAVVTNWSLPWPVPAVDPASLEKIELEHDDALRKAIQPHIDALKGNNAPVKANENPTEDSAK